MKKLENNINKCKRWQSEMANTAVVTIHDACPAFSTKLFKLSDELES